MSERKRILFSGYAPVHFLCFQPIYERLRNDPRVEVYLSGGFRRKSGDETSFEIEGFYDPYDVDQTRVVPPSRLPEEQFDTIVCSHLSDTLFPGHYSKSVQITHGVSFKNLAVRDKALRYDFICLAGDYHAEKYAEQGLVPSDGSSIIVTGLAKTDALVDGSLDREETLAAIGVDSTRPTLLFAPTGDKHNALEIWGEKLLSELSAHQEWNLLIKPHDHPKNAIDWFDRLQAHESDRIKLVRDTDIIPYLHASDLLLTDASSVAVEYTLLDRPIVFLDVPKLFKRLAARAPALDLDTYGRKIGKVVSKGESIAHAVSSSLQGCSAEERAIRRKMASHVFEKPGGAADRVTQVVLHASGLDSQLEAPTLAARQHAS